MQTPLAVLSELATMADRISDLRKDTTLTHQWTPAETRLVLTACDRLVDTVADVYDVLTQQMNP